MAVVKSHTTSSAATDAHRTAGATAAHQMFYKLEELVIKTREEKHRTNMLDLQQLVLVKPIPMPMPTKCDLEYELERLMESVGYLDHCETDVQPASDSISGQAAETKIDSPSSTCAAHDIFSSLHEGCKESCKETDNGIREIQSQQSKSHEHQCDGQSDERTGECEWTNQVPHKKTTNLQDGLNFTRDFLLLAGVGLGDDIDADSDLSLETVANHLSSRTTSIAFAGVAAHDCVDRPLASTLSKALGRQVLPPKAIWHIERDQQCQAEILLLHDAKHNNALYKTNDHAPCLFSDIGDFWRPEVVPIVKELEKKPWLAPDALAGLLMVQVVCILCSSPEASQPVSAIRLSTLIAFFSLD